MLRLRSRRSGRTRILWITTWPSSPGSNTARQAFGATDFSNLAVSEILRNSAFCGILVPHIVVIILCIFNFQTVEGGGQGLRGFLNFKNFFSYSIYEDITKLCLNFKGSKSIPMKSTNFPWLANSGESLLPGLRPDRGNHGGDAGEAYRQHRPGHRLSNASIVLNAIGLSNRGGRFSFCFWVMDM